MGWGMKRVGGGREEGSCKLLVGGDLAGWLGTVCRCSRWRLDCAVGVVAFGEGGVGLSFLSFCRPFVL